MIVPYRSLADFRMTGSARGVYGPAVDVPCVVTLVLIKGGSLREGMARNCAGARGGGFMVFSRFGTPPQNHQNGL